MGWRLCPRRRLEFVARHTGISLGVLHFFEEAVCPLYAWLTDFIQRRQNKWSPI